MTGRMLRTCLMPGLAITLVACAVSEDVHTLRPVVAESDAIFDARLVGTWEWVDGKNVERAVISRDTGKPYSIEYDKYRFEARLGRLGGRQVLDVWPAPPDTTKLDMTWVESLNNFHGYLLTPAHLLLVLDLRADSLLVSAFERDSLVVALASGKVRLPYIELGDSARNEGGTLLLGGTTSQLRLAIGPYLAGGGALGKPSAFRRVPDARSSPVPSR